MSRSLRKAGEYSARWVSKAMAEAGVSQLELARRLGIASSGISRAVNGRHDLRLATLLRILDACGLEVVELRVRRSICRAEAETQVTK
jgi:transcriptional regulator with XRE-family HTH domain